MPQSRVNLLGKSLLCAVLTFPLAAKAEDDAVAIDVLPARISLSGPLAAAQLVVTGRYQDGNVRDLTGECRVTVEREGIVEVASGGLVRPRGNGESVLVVEAGGKSARVPVEVSEFDRPAVSFRRDVIAALGVSGCNSGACHGSPNGRNGFQLSLRGGDPEADYLHLTREGLGRRTDAVRPQASLILEKALGRIPHEGGKRFAVGSIPERILRTWLEAGLPSDPADLPQLQAVEVLPGSRILHAPAATQQLAVLARFADGSIRDVTRLTVFASSDESVATVDATGRVEFRAAGETAILCRYLDRMQTVRLTHLKPRPGYAWPNPPEANYVDTHVFAKLKHLQIPPSDLSSDSAFVRRVHLDVCGRLPTPEEVKKFLADNRPDKRALLIDALLDTPEYADFRTLKWLDVLRNSRKALKPEGAEGYRKWVHDHISKNTPFDRVVRELLTATGDTFASPPANYFRISKTPQELVETTSQLMLGVRIQCAQCHNHPYERWTQDDYHGLAAFFGRVKHKNQPTVKGSKAGPESILVEGTGEVKHLRTGQVVAPKFLGGPTPTIAANQDRREALADWLTSADNPFFARSVVNRLWYHLFGRGIVEPVDDFRESNPPANDELLDALTKDFVAHRFDVKHVLRTILNSRTYQLSAVSNEFNRTDERYFSRALPRLMTAEQMLDALCDATEVPENFRGVPRGTRAVQLPDGEVNHPFLKAFGQPPRESSCECERSSESTLFRAIQMVNGPTINDKITAPKNRLGRLSEKNLSAEEMLNEVYLATFSRLPSPEEKQAALAHLEQATDKRKAWEDLHWTLLNTREFLFRH